MQFIDEINKCESIPELIEFIEGCREVATTQKQLALQADKLHNQAIQGIKYAKRRLKELNQ